MLRNTCNSTGSAAELCIVLIPAVSGFYNQFAVREIWIVYAIILNLEEKTISLISVRCGYCIILSKTNVEEGGKCLKIKFEI